MLDLRFKNHYLCLSINYTSDENVDIQPLRQNIYIQNTYKINLYKLICSSNASHKAFDSTITSLKIKNELSKINLTYKADNSIMVELEKDSHYKIADCSEKKIMINQGHVCIITPDDELYFIAFCNNSELPYSLNHMYRSNIMPSTHPKTATILQSKPNGHYIPDTEI